MILFCIKFLKKKKNNLEIKSPGLFPGRIAATVFSLKAEFKEKAESLSLHRRPGNVAKGLNFEI